MATLIAGIAFVIGASLVLFVLVTAWLYVRVANEHPGPIRVCPITKRDPWLIGPGDPLYGEDEEAQAMYRDTP